MKYDAIIFDLGGVIINLDYNRTVEEFKKLGIENFDEMYSQASQTNLFDEFETGKLSAQHFVNSILNFLPAGTSPNKVVKAWNSMILNVPAEKLNLLDRVRKQTAIYMLSNTNELHVPVVRREWAKISARPPEDYFEKIYFSHELKMRKPNPETFLHVCATEGLNPEATLFIDDSLQHIEGAKKAGLKVFHLSNSVQLYQLFS